MNADQDNVLSNRREQARRKAIQGGRIVFNDRKSTMNCRVRDLSAGGARLEIPLQQLLPHSFELHIASEPIRRCELRWVKGNLAGVRFLQDEE